MTTSKKITKTLKTIGGIRFWLMATVAFIVLSVLGYLASSKVVYGSYIEKYEKLDPFAKDLISVQG